VSVIRDYDDTSFTPQMISTRQVLKSHLSDPVLIDMLLCPVMYYGSAEEHDLDFTSFVTLFKSILLEGFARPPGGVRTIIKLIVRKFRSCGGKLVMNQAVESINTRDGAVSSLTLADGEDVTADTYFSSIGAHETLRLCPEALDEALLGERGRLSFVESIVVLDSLPQTMGLGASITFFSDQDRFDYSVPKEPVDLRSGVICCPTNYQNHEHMTEGLFRLTWLANYERWAGYDESEYKATKQAYHDDLFRKMCEVMPEARSHVIDTDMFTPRTIEQYTGHLGEIGRAHV